MENVLFVLVCNLDDNLIVLLVAVVDVYLALKYGESVHVVLDDSMRRIPCEDVELVLVAVVVSAAGLLTYHLTTRLPSFVLHQLSYPYKLIDVVVSAVVVFYVYGWVED